RFFHGQWIKLKKTAGWLGPILVLAVMVLGIQSWLEGRIDKAVERKLTDETILRKIAAQARPSLIFDAKESILSDMGAVQLVKDIRIAKRNQSGWPERIEVEFTRHFANPPVLTALYDSVAIFPQ